MLLRSPYVLEFYSLEREAQAAEERENLTNDTEDQLQDVCEHNNPRDKENKETYGTNRMSAP
jgi:hypothetical protein